MDPAAVYYSIECNNGTNGRCESSTVSLNLNVALVLVTFLTEEKSINITLTSTGICGDTETSSLIASGAGKQIILVAI